MDQETEINPKDLIGKTIQYTTHSAKNGARTVKGLVVEVSEVGGEEPWFKILEDLDSPSGLFVAVWYALGWIADWKVFD